MAEALRDRARPESPRPRQARPDRPRVEARPEATEEKKAGDQSSRQELEATRKQIHDLQDQLKRATRRLEELQSREPRRPATPRRATEPAKPARPAEPRRPETPRRPAEPAKPAEPARPAEPRRPEPPARPAAPRRENARPGADSERRLRNLEETLNRLLKDLEELKRQKPEDSDSRLF